MPNEKEICTIEVGGTKFRDWETVHVEAEFPNVHRTGIFTVSEGNPAGRKMAAKKIKTQDTCSISLGGDPVLTGYVVQRQTFMDANNHAVLIQAHSKPADCVRCAIVGQDQFKNKTIEEIAKIVYGPFSVDVVKRGRSEGMDLKIPDVQVMQGESPFHLIERLARSRSCWIGDDEKGNLVLDGGSQGGGGGSTLKEGKDIKWIRATIVDTELMSSNFIISQSRGEDKHWGSETTEIFYESKDARMKRHKPSVHFVERPGAPGMAPQEAKIRAEHETAWRAGTLITCEIGLQGWHKSGGGGLWAPGPDQIVTVESDSAMVNGDLAVKKVTWKQSNAEGTMTILELVDPAHYNGGQYQL